MPLDGEGRKFLIGGMATGVKPLCRNSGDHRECGVCCCGNNENRCDRLGVAGEGLRLEYEELAVWGFGLWALEGGVGALRVDTKEWIERSGAGEVQDGERAHELAVWGPEMLIARTTGLFRSGISMHSPC